MSGTAMLLTLVALATGAMIAMQAPINAELAARLGHPLSAALWFNGAAFLAVALLVWRLPEPRLVPGRGKGGKPAPTPAE